MPVGRGDRPGVGVVPDHAPRCHHATQEYRFRDDAAWAENVRQCVAVDGAIAVVHEKEQQVAGSGLHRERFAGPRQIPPVCLEHAVTVTVTV